MMATVHPAARQRDATTDAPEPVPITTTSYCFSIHVTPVKVTPSGRSSGRLATWALSGGGGQPCDIGRQLRAQYTRVRGRWHAVEHLGGPPSGLPNRSPRPSPRTTLAASAYPILHGMSRLRFAALHLAASRSGGLPRRAGARTEVRRGGRQRGALRAPEGMLPRRQGKKSTRRVLPRPPGVCPWRAVSALCRRRVSRSRRRCRNSRSFAASICTIHAVWRPALAAPGGRYWALVSWGDRGRGRGGDRVVGAHGGKAVPRRPIRAGCPAGPTGWPAAGEAPPGTPWQGRRQAGSVGRVSAPRRGHKGAGWRG